MKTLILTALMMVFSFGVQAKSVLNFKTVNKCQTYKKGEPITVQIQESQDGQAQLIIAYPRKQEEAIKVQVKKILPPKEMAGGTLKYVGKNEITKENVKLSFTSGTAPLKIGKIIGKGATLSLEKQDGIQLVCVAVK